MKIDKEESLIKINTDILNKIKLYENNKDELEIIHKNYQIAFRKV